MKNDFITLGFALLFLAFALGSSTLAFKGIVRSSLPISTESNMTGWSAQLMAIFALCTSMLFLYIAYVILRA